MDAGGGGGGDDDDDDDDENCFVNFCSLYKKHSVVKHYYKISVSHVINGVFKPEP